MWETSHCPFSSAWWVLALTVPDPLHVLPYLLQFWSNSGLFWNEAKDWREGDHPQLCVYGVVWVLQRLQDNLETREQEHIEGKVRSGEVWMPPEQSAFSSLLKHTCFACVSVLSFASSRHPRRILASGFPEKSRESLLPPWARYTHMIW